LLASSLKNIGLLTFFNFSNFDRDLNIFLILLKKTVFPTGFNPLAKERLSINPMKSPLSLAVLALKKIEL